MKATRALRRSNGEANHWNYSSDRGSSLSLLKLARFPPLDPSSKATHMISLHILRRSGSVMDGYLTVGIHSDSLTVAYLLHEDVL